MAKAITHCEDMMGVIADYGVIGLGDVLRVWRGMELVWAEEVPGFGCFVAAATELCCGLATFADQTHAVYVYDLGGDGYGFAVHVDEPECSGWRYAPRSR